MISKMVGNSAVGVYSTLYTVSSLSLMVWTAINASFYTVFVPRHGKPEKQNQKTFYDDAGNVLFGRNFTCVSAFDNATLMITGGTGSLFYRSEALPGF